MINKLLHGVSIDCMQQAIFTADLNDNLLKFAEFTVLIIRGHFPPEYALLYFLLKAVAG